MATKKHICSYADYAHVADISNIKGDKVFFQDGKEWKRINAKSKITYQGTSENPDAGSIMRETVTITADSKDVEELLNGLEYYVLKLFVGSQTFIVGSLDYPSKKTFTDDKVRVSITFSCAYPLK